MRGNEFDPPSQAALMAARIGVIGTEEAFSLGALIAEVEGRGNRVIKANLGQPDFPLPDFQELCGGPLNEGPQPLVLQRAWADLVRWVEEGTPPAASPLLELADDGTIVRDELGIAVGGIRTPDVDVPIAVFSGEPRPGASVICSLFGSTTPLPADVIADLYPTHDEYVAQVRASAEAALDAGFLLPDGVDVMVAEANAAAVPG